MQVILTTDVRKVGKKGEIKNVKDGFGQNYLIKNGYAKPATPKNLNDLKLQNQREEKLDQQNKEKALEEAKKLAKIKIKFKAKTGAGDKMFGSISVKQIKEKLDEQGFSIDKKKFELDHPITSLGFHDVTVHLYTGVDATIKIEVTK